MGRTLRTIMAVCLGALALTGTACENKETEAALKTCKSDLGNEQKKATDQQNTINDLKAQLAKAQARIDEMNKAAPQAGKPDEKAKAGEAKKENAAKGEKKGRKK
jgi:hypothetical protein